MKNITDAVVEKLCKYMGQKNFTQYRLAEKSGLPFSTVKSIMQKKTKNISLKTVICLCKGVEVPLAEFLDDKAFSHDNLNFDA